jgi:3alpha(or 20beta)-hydroxysteroid dehydrogenase
MSQAISLGYNCRSTGATLLNSKRPSIALVTGAASGLGAAIATCLADKGYSMVVSDIDAEGAKKLADSLPNAISWRLDVADSRDWLALGSMLEARGGLDVLVNNAAIYRPRTMSEETAEGFEQVFRVNQLSVLLGMQMASNLMCTQGSGSIINISSTGGLRAYPGTIAYASTKWAVRGMSKVAAVELAPYGVRVNSIHPGLCETPMAYENTPELLDELKSSIPLGRLGRPEEIARAVLFLADASNSYMTGSELVIDGAATA